MKKLLMSFVLLSTLGISYASSCVDLPGNLSRYQESSNILAFQNFLFEKGYLKGTPNGYFGAGTFAAVKAYQKSVGLQQVGNVGPGTRAALKKDTCSSQNKATTNPVPATVKTEPAKTSVVATTTAITKTEPAPTATPSSVRNAKRREDLEKILRALHNRYVDTRGANPVAILASSTEFCVPPPRVVTIASSSEGNVVVTAASLCDSYVDISTLVPRYLSYIPRDPNIATGSMMIGYTIIRGEYNDITLTAKNPEEKAIIQVRCNFTAGCPKIEHISTITYSKPTLTSLDNPIFLKDSSPKDPITIKGFGFTQKNKVYLFSNYTSREYFVGEFESKDSFTIPVTGVALNQELSCGNGCKEKLPLGDYTVTVRNEGGTSNNMFLSVKGYNTSAFSARSNSSVTPKTKNVKLGTFSVSSSIPLNLISITLKATSTATNLPNKLSNFVLKDPLTNVSVTGVGTFSLTGQSLYENQSKLYDLYADVDEVLVADSGFMTYGGTIKVKDVLLGKELDLPLKEFSFTVSY